MRESLDRSIGGNIGSFFLGVSELLLSCRNDGTTCETVVRVVVESDGKLPKSGDWIEGWVDKMCILLYTEKDIKDNLICQICLLTSMTEQALYPLFAQIYWIS